MSYKGANFESFWQTWNFISAATSGKHFSYIKDVKVPRNELKKKCLTKLIARSLVVSDLRSETKGSWFESGCQLCAEVSSLQ